MCSALCEGPIIKVGIDGLHQKRRPSQMVGDELSFTIRVEWVGSRWWIVDWQAWLRGHILCHGRHAGHRNIDILLHYTTGAPRQLDL